MERCSADRRQRSAFWIWPERRRGFDRRARSWVEPLRGQPLVLLGVLCLLNVLNVLDWHLTEVALARGAVEGNPIMSEIFEVSPWAAALFKIAVLSVVSVAVWRGREYRRMLEFAVLATGLFSVLVAYHIIGAMFLLPAGHP